MKAGTQYCPHKHCVASASVCTSREQRPSSADVHHFQNNLIWSGLASQRYSMHVSRPQATLNIAAIILWVVVSHDFHCCPLTEWLLVACMKSHPQKEVDSPPQLTSFLPEAGKGSSLWKPENYSSLLFTPCCMSRVILSPSLNCNHMIWGAYLFLSVTSLFSGHIIGRSV